MQMHPPLPILPPSPTYPHHFVSYSSLPPSSLPSQYSQTSSSDWPSWMHLCTFSGVTGERRINHCAAACTFTMTNRSQAVSVTTQPKGDHPAWALQNLTMTWHERTPLRTKMRKYMAMKKGKGTEPLFCLLFYRKTTQQGRDRWIQSDKAYTLFCTVKCGCV